MQAIYTIILVTVLCLFSLHTGNAQTYFALKAENKDLKTQLEKITAIHENNKAIKELLLKNTLELNLALETAQNKVSALKVDKEHIHQNLQDMKAWGIQQQKEKVAYYNETQIVRSELAQAKQKYIDEKTKHDKTKAKYHRLKIFLGATFGAVLLLLYFRFGSPIVSQTAKLTGAWSPIVEILAPISVFVLGFLIVFLLF